MHPSNEVVTEAFRLQIAELILLTFKYQVEGSKEKVILAYSKVLMQYAWKQP